MHAARNQPAKPMNPQAEQPLIVVVGSHAPGLFMHVDRVPVAGETVMGWGYAEPMDGGKGSNQAIAAARLGAQVSFVGCVGTDRFGDLGEAWLLEAGVETRFLKRSSSEATVGGFVILDKNGIPAIVAALGANGELTAADAESALTSLPNGTILLTQFEIRPEVAVHAVQVGRRLGMRTILNPAPAVDSDVSGLDSADFLTPNESEAKALLGQEQEIDTAPDKMAERLLERTGAGCVCLTIGERGAMVADKNGTRHFPAPQVEAVDTTGAGDCFNAALAVQLLHGASLDQAVQYACLAAAYSVTKQGTIPIFPTHAQVEAFSAQHRI